MALSFELLYSACQHFFFYVCQTNITLLFCFLLFWWWLYFWFYKCWCETNKYLLQFLFFYTEMERNNHLSPDVNIPSVQINSDSQELSQERLVSRSFTCSYGAPPQVENQMQRELKYFFMNPYEKYKARGRKPWKLCIQILKIFFVTTQVSNVYLFF